MNRTTFAIALMLYSSCVVQCTAVGSCLCVDSSSSSSSLLYDTLMSSGGHSNLKNYAKTKFTVVRPLL